MQLTIDFDKPELSQAEMVLRYLKSGPKTTNFWLDTPPLGAEYRARISELRRSGHRIEATPVPGTKRKNWLYRLIDAEEE